MRFTHAHWIAAIAAASLAACGGGDGNGGNAGGTGGPIGGGGSGGNTGEDHAYLIGGDARFVVIADESKGLDVPRDLDFHPERGEAWIVNRADDSVTIVWDAIGAAELWEHRIDGYALHFMEEVSSISFGAKNFDGDYTFGTCQESGNTYNGQSAPNNFMGPALWSAHPDVFAMSNPFGLGAHLDMLHESPYCMGIAHEVDNVYWVFDGHNSRIVRYDFQKDHDIGQDDHSDGIIHILGDPRVTRVPDVPSHLHLDKEARRLYIADTGNKRVLWLDIDSGEFGSDISSFSKDGGTLERWRNFDWDEFVPADSGLLELPSGVTVHDGVVYVSDNARGEIFAFDLEGELLTRMTTDAAEGGLMGIEVGPDDRLYYTDAVSNRVVRVERDR